MAVANKWVVVAAMATLGLGGCASTGAGSANANGPTQAPSGVTSSNGGGQRAIGDIPSIGSTTGVGPTVGAVPNSKGASY